MPMPMPPTAPDAAMAMQPPGAMPPEAGEGGYTVCIKVSADGAMMVGLEGMGDAGESTMQPAATIKEALTLAMEIIKNNGEMTASEADKDFDAGFAGTQGGM